MASNQGRRPDLPGVVPMRADPAEVEIPAPPHALAEDAVAVWNAYASDLQRIGRLETVHHEMFAQFCIYASIFRRASAQVAIEGFDMTNASGLSDQDKAKLRNGVQFKASPAWRQMNESASWMLRLSDLFGLTPKAAVALSGQGQGDLFDDVVRAMKQRANAAA